MLSRKVIATDVTNLTDARYFAARGIDYLLFNMTSISVEKVLEIKDWVEGPRILLVFTKASLPLLDESIIKLAPTAISIDDKSLKSDMGHLSGHVDVFDYAEGEILLDDLSYRKISNSSSLRLLRGDQGIIVSGGTEEAVGVRNFDDLDEVLDALDNK